MGDIGPEEINKYSNEKGQQARERNQRPVDGFLIISDFHPVHLARIQSVSIHSSFAF